MIVIDASKPFISKIQARADEFLQPLPLKNSRDNWRPHPPTVDLTNSPNSDDDDKPVIISRPQAFPTFHSSNRVNPAGLGFTINTGFPDPSQDRRLPPMYSIPGGGAIPGVNGSYYGGTYVDHEKTTESIKELLEGNNDSPPLKKKGKKSKKVDDELASMMEEKATLSDGMKEEDREDEEDEEEEDTDVVEGLNVKLLPHQVRGLKFLRGREQGKARGGILADDVWPCPT